jgi:hypothetical protein
MRHFAVFVLFAAISFGQVSTGNIRGTVTDPSGAVVADVKVTLTNVRTGVQQSVKSDNSGNYLIEFLPTSEYQITAEVPGFKKFLRANISLDMSRQLRVDIPIEPGLVTETVSVTARTSPAWARPASQGWTLASEGGYVVALSTTLTESLRLEGRARDPARVCPHRSYQLVYPPHGRTRKHPGKSVASHRSHHPSWSQRARL